MIKRLALVGALALWASVAQADLEYGHHPRGTLDSGEKEYIFQSDTNLKFYNVTDAKTIGLLTSTGRMGLGGITEIVPQRLALLDLSSTTQVFLPIRLTTAQRDALSSVPTGAVIFNYTTTKLECYDGSTWQVAW